MRFFAFTVTALIVAIFGVVAFEGMGLVLGHTPTPKARSAAQIRFDPGSAPQYVQLLKDQAKERESFFQEQARAKRELKNLHARQREDLKVNHRERRRQFEQEKQDLSARRSFYRSLQGEMSALKSRQKAEARDLNSQLRGRLKDFHSAQKDRKDALLRELSSPVPETASSSS